MDKTIDTQTLHRAALSGETDQDHLWVEASRKGDPVAFNRLVLKWEGKVYNLILRTLNDSEEAADTTQEVFLAAFRSISRFKGQARFSTWLFRIALNRCISRLRRRPPVMSPLEEATNSAFVPALASPGKAPDDLLFSRERRRQVLDGLASLSPQQRAVVELKFFQEQTFETCAEILGLPSSTVKSRFYSALDVLRQHFRHMEEEYE